MAGQLDDLDRLGSLVDGVAEIDAEDAVLKAVNDLSDYSVKKTLLALLRQTKKEVEDEKFTPEGNRFILMALAGNLAQFQQ